jgi:hypothetical protein
MTGLRRLALVLTISAAAVAAVVAGAAADGGGPSPGISFGGAGVTGAGGALRFVAIPARVGTVIESVSTRNGRVINWAPIRGLFGIPLVAYDGAAGGLSRDLKTLVLASYPGRPGPGTVSRFAVFDTSRHRVRQSIVLRGTYSYDAIAPDGSTMYLIQYTSTQDWNRYRVRAYDIRLRKLFPGAIVDRREPAERMSGSPMTRATSPDGAWAYTLYASPSGAHFIHALDTVRRTAFCIDLPWRNVALGALQGVRMTISGRELVLTQRPLGRLATVDTRTFAVHALKAPAADGFPAG